MKVYFISGMGADSRVFKHIELPAGFEKVHLDWIPPIKKESLASYSSRLAEKIDASENFALLGLSMGGMIAIEISKKLAPVTTIILSSIPTSNNLPKYFKIAQTFQLHKLVPISLIKSTTILKRFFTNEVSADKKILRQVIQESDPVFLRWAMGAVLEWKNDFVPKHLLHIHGTKDEILPLRFTQPTHTIKMGTHMMVMSKAPELNNILKDLCKSMAVTDSV